MTNAAASKWPHPPTNKKINGKKWPNWDPQLHLMLYLDNGIWSWGSYTVTLHCDCDEQQTQWGPGQGKRCCSVGFLCSFFSGSPSQVTFHLAGGGGGDIFLIMDPNSTECISTWLRSDNDANHGTSRRLNCTDAYFLLYPNQHVKSSDIIICAVVGTQMNWLRQGLPVSVMTM